MISDRLLGERHARADAFAMILGVARMLRGRRAIWILSLVVLATALAVDTLLVAPLPSVVPQRPIPWWVLAAVFAVAEIFVVEFTSRQDTHSFTLSELPLVLGLFLLPPGELVVAQFVGGTAALLIQGPRQPVKILFNMANFMLGTAFAVLIFHHLVPPADPLGPGGWVAGFVAAFVSDTLATLLVLTVISLSEGRPPKIPRLVGLGTLYTFADTSLALVGVVVLVRHPIAGWLLIVLAMVFFFGYRAYGSMRQRHESLVRLQTSTRSLSIGPSVDRVAETLVERAFDMFGASRVDLWLRDGAATLRRLSRSSGTDASAWSGTAGHPDILRLLPDRASRLAGEAVAAFLGEAASMPSTMAVPLRGDDETFGALIVSSADGTWREEHQALLETFANHAGVAVENARLVERLQQQAQRHEHDATHDALTGLPNRVLFHRRLTDAATRGAADAGGFAVLIMDLDRFKEVNDTLGHHSGDVLLRQVADRLQRALGDVAFIARLSGDEFAMVTHHVADGLVAGTLARRILAEFETPIEIQEMQVDVEASVGIALFPEHGGDGETLLQRADVAMYQAKEAHSGFEIYRPDRDQYSSARLALMGELRMALERDQLRVAFQPQLHVAKGRIGGAEALVRWAHPRHGEIAASDFVPLAEHTGLIRPLTLFVLHVALDHCRAWREEGIEIGVSVNLSARNLLDPTLADDVASALDERGLPARVLTVEITETSLMSDPVRTDALLRRLRGMGVGISIDDFGTGYASLAYLKRFPVTELKIDRDFVRSIDVDADDLRIVESTIALAHALGLRVVAEGAETATVTRTLQKLGCDVIQGFDVDRPMSAEMIRLRLLDERDRLGPAGMADVVPAARARTQRAATAS